MSISENRKMTLSFWLTIPLLLLYTYPVYTVPFTYWFSEKFTQGCWLYMTFVPFLGERQGLLNNVTRILAPLVAMFAAVAFVGPRNFRRTIILILIIIILLFFSFIDISILTDEKNLASLNAHEINKVVTRAGVYATLERYQEALFAVIASILGITIAAKPKETKK